MFQFPHGFIKQNAITEGPGDPPAKSAFIVTDTFLYDNGYVTKVTKTLDKLGIQSEVFADVKPDPDLETIYKGLDILNVFKPDVIIALGGGSPMDAAKIMWLMYEQPLAKFSDLAMRFMDIRKRIYKFPQLGKKAFFVAIPTTSELAQGTLRRRYRRENRRQVSDCGYELTLTWPSSILTWSCIRPNAHCIFRNRRARSRD